MSEKLLNDAIEIMEDNPAEAKRLVNRVLEYPNQNVEIRIRCYQLLANAARYQNDYPNAQKWLGEAERLFPKAENKELKFYQYLEAAQLAARFNYISDAEQNYKWAIEVTRETPTLDAFGTAAYAMYADLKIDLQDFEAAYELLTRAIEQEKSREYSMLLSMLETKLADLFLYLDLPEDAAALLESAEEHAEPDDKAFLFRARVELALNLDAHPQLAKLAEHFEADPEYTLSADLTHTMIAAYIRIHAYEKAEIHLERLDKFYQQTGQEINLYYLYTSAIELYKGTQNFQKGREFFAKAQHAFPHEDQPSYSWILYQSYARLLWKEGSILEALDAFQMAVEYLEAYRLRVPDEPNRLRFYSDKFIYLNEYVAMALEVGQNERALHWLEASKSLTLLDHLQDERLHYSFQLSEIVQILTQSPSNMKKALLEFFHDEPYLYAFLLRPDKKERKLQVFKLEVKEEEIVQAVTEIRTAIEKLAQLNQGVGVDQINRVSLPAFEVLGAKIFSKDLQEAMTDLEGTYIVPFEHLHYLPIHAMPFGEHFLIDQMAVAYLPAASLLPYVPTESPFLANSSHFLGIGVDAWGNYSAFSQEIHKIQTMDLWSNTRFRSLRNEAAIKPNILPQLPNADIIHFSTHGYFSQQDSLESGLLLYEEDEEFVVSEREGTDLILSAYELREQQLKAELVVMSACVTGQSENHPGDELLGLSRALLFAGAKSMILTLFASFKGTTVHPETHIGHFYQYWLAENQSKAQAFRNYIRLVKDHPLFSHPLFWFPYIYIGSLE